jgi:peroxiredoxin
VQSQWTDEQRAAPASAAPRTLLIMVKEVLQLPDDLPVPQDDGAADHLAGMVLPAVALRATDGTSVRLDELEGRTVVFAYPRTGRPGESSPGGDEEWDAIPGARGCTPQACSFRDEHVRFAAADVRVLGLSTQDTAYQQEAAERLHLPYPLLSDERLELATALGLPTFEVDGLTLLKRITLFLHDGSIESVIYPVFPPDRSAQQALTRLRA